MTTSLTSPRPTARSTAAGDRRRPRRRTPGLGDPMMVPSDRLGPFNPAVLAVRWSTTVVCVVLAAAGLADGDPVLIPWVAAVVVNTAIRSVTPLQDDGGVQSQVNLLLEIGLNVLAVAGTGYWASPLVLCLVNAIIVAGFARGFSFSLRIGVVSAVAVSLPSLADGWTAAEATVTAQWTTMLVLVAIVAGYARRISGEASRQQTVTLDRLSRLADANALLFSLHQIAQTLPASLDLDEVLDSTMTRLRDLVEHHGAAVLLLDDTDDTWSVGRRHGLRLDSRLGWDELPVAAARAARARRLEVVGDLRTGGPGFSSGHAAGLYAPLTARGHLVGLLVVEHRDSGAFGPRESEILRGFIEPVSLAIDNARWFSRLRTVGADDERTRIARDLHDRIGQSLAYLAFELDRIITRDAAGDDVSTYLAALRGDVRTVVGEVRETLYDLRSDVTGSKDLPTAVCEHAHRVSERSTLIVDVDCDGQQRLPLLQERELWRIAQEALTNVERHAGASRATVVWRCDGASAVLEVSDDGVGFPLGTARRQDSYGVLGMRERAASIGAALDIHSQPGEGTTVRCYLEHR